MMGSKLPFPERFYDLEKGLVYRRFLEILISLRITYIILAPLPRRQHVLCCNNTRILSTREFFFFLSGSYSSDLTETIVF